MSQTVKVVKKIARLKDLEQIIKLQLLLASFLDDTKLSEGDLNFLTHVAIHGYHRGTPALLKEKGVFLNRQSSINTRGRVMKKDYLIYEDGEYKLHPRLNIHQHGTVMVDLKAINLAT